METRTEVEHIRLKKNWIYKLQRFSKLALDNHYGNSHYSKSYISQMFWSKKSCMKKLRMVCDFWDELRLRIQSQAQRHKFPEPKERQSNTNEIIWLKKCLKKFRPKYYKRFVDDILKNLSIYNDFLHIPKAYLNINSVRNTETQSRFFWRRLYGLLRFIWYYRLKLTIFFYFNSLR